MLLVYLAVIVVYKGLPHLYAGEYLLFYGVVGGSLLVIMLLYLSLRYKQRLRQKRENEQYAHYDSAYEKSENNANNTTKIEHHDSAH